MRDERTRSTASSSVRRIDLITEIVRNSAGAVAAFDRGMRYVAASAGWRDTYGQDRADLTGLCHYDLWPALPERWKAVHRRGLAGEHVRESEDSFELPDGTLGWLDWSVSPWRDESGEVGGVVMTAVDITARKRSERALRDSETRYRALVEGSPDAILVHTDGRIVYANAAALALFGAPDASALLGRSPYDLIDPSLHALAVEREAGHARHQPQPRVVITTRPLSGPAREVEVNSILTTFDGRAAVYGVLRDVTDARALARERDETETRFTALAENVPEAFSFTDAERRRILYVSPGFDRVYGLSRADVLEDPRRWLAIVHPGDREAIAAGMVRSDEHEITFRIVHPGNADTRWIRLRTWPIRDASGAVVSVGTLSEDVTERKRAEERIRDSEERYRELVEGSPNAIFVHVDRRLVYVNAAAERLFGAPASALLGRPIAELIAPEHRALVAHRQASFERGEPVPRVVVATQPVSGEPREVEVTAMRASFEGHPAVQVVARDVTDERRLARERAETEARFEELAANIDQVFTVWTADRGRVLYLSPSFESVFGVPAAEVIADPSRWMALVHPDDRGSAPGAYPYEHEYRIVRPDGAVRWVRSRVRPIAEADAVVRRVAGVVEDITDRKRAELALRESEDRYRRLVEASPYAIFVHVERRILFGNAAAARLFGLKEPGELAGRTLWEVLHPSVHEQTEARLTALERGQPLGGRLLTKIRGREGEPRDTEVTPTPITYEGQPAILAMMRDVTDERRNARAARENEARLEAIVSSAMDAIISTDESLTIVLANPASEQLFGYGPGELLGKRLEVLLPPRIRLRHAEAMRRFAASDVAHRQMVGGALTGMHRDGTEIPLDASIAKTELDGHTLFTVMHRDLRPRLAAERAARDSEERFLELAENVDVVFAVVSADRARVLYLSPAFDRMFGLQRAEVLAGTARMTDVVHPDDRPILERARTTDAYDLEYRIIRPDGTVRWLSGRARPVRDADGHLARYVGIITDITDRRALEGQLEQSQKLESVGRLAGGLAHDFNNLLTVVTSASELLHDEPLSDEASSLLGEIDDAGRRGAALTRQLLSFSRQDILEPIVVELGGLVEEALRLLRRLIGENVQLTHTRRDAVRVRVDAGQWDQVLVNLVVNARDAMPKGGTLRVETGGIVLGGIDARFPDAAPGPYALLRVADSGEGMTPEVRARIFEPFFTTKPRQQGTGLGLAVVYGIVKQAGGHIHVDSEPGRGTTFSILVPLSERPADAPTTASARQRALGGGPETILLVEDDDAVRRVASRSLSQRGYEVLTAPDGEAALAVLERRSVDLVVTDVVMPNLDGPSLVRVVRTRWPRIKVLLSTGYIDGSLEMHELADHPVLRKPYSQQKLLEKVCEVLRG